MNRKEVMLLVLGFLFVIALVSSAQPTYQYAKIYMNPLYRVAMEQGVQYDYDLHIDTPDGMSEVVNAMVTMQLWLNPTIEFEVLVDGQHCNNPTFEVHTTYAGAGEGTIYFDCSNIIKGEGDYIVSIIPDDDTGSSTFWVDLTYANAPKGTVEVHGTEYSPAADGKIWLILLNSTGDAVIDGACQVDIYTPNNEIYVENAAMTNMLHDGIYYYDLITPQAQGVYPAIAKCYYDVLTTSEFADGFILTTGVVDDKDYTETWALDGQEHKIKQDNGVIDFQYNVDNMCGLTTDELFLTGLELTVNAKWKDTITNDNIILSIYNHTSSSWIDLPNLIIAPNDRVTVTNFVTSNNYTRDGLVDGSGTLDIRFHDTLTAGTDEKIEVDLVEVACLQYANPIWTEVKGSSEMHITSDNFWVIDEDSITGNVTGETYLGYMYFDMTVSSQTSSLKEGQDISFTAPTPFPCHHILNVTVEGVDTYWWGVDDGSEACEIHWEQDLEPHTNYDVQIKSENWWKLEIRAWENEVDTVNGFFTAMCNFYALENDYPPYVIPKEEKLNDSYDNFYKSCSSILDYYDHINESLENEYSFDEAVLNFEQMALLNANWRHLSITIDQYNAQANDIMGTLGVATDMSVAALGSGNSDDYFYFWANVSTPYLIYEQTSDITVNVNTTAVADAVWDYDGVVSSNLLSQFASSIWGYVNRTLTGFGDLVDNIWTAPSRNLTYYPATTDETNYTLVENLITSNADDKTNYTLIQELVTDYGNDNYDLTNYTQIQNLIDQYGNQLTAQAIWEYASRNLTYYPEQIDLTNYTLIDNLIALYENDLSAQDVWGYSNRTLTDYDHQTQLDLTNYTLVQDLISSYGNDLTAGIIWSYANRNLTYYPVQTDLTNYTLVEDLVSSYSNNISEQSIWEYVNRSLTNYDHQTQLDLTNYTLVQNLISSYGNDLTSSLIWDYANRNLTYYPVQTDLTNYTLVEDLISQYENNLTAGQIWEYATRNLTYYPEQTDLTNYTLVGDLITALGNDNSDLTNYTLVGDLITALGNDDNTNYTLVQDIVTAYGNEDNANYTLMQDLITSYGNEDNTNYTLVQEIVVDYGNDDNTNYTLIGDLITALGNDNHDLTNYTLMQEIVSNFGNDDETNYTLIESLVATFGNEDNANYTLIEDLITQFGNSNEDLTNYTAIQDLITLYGNEDNTNYTLISDMVWSATTRTLTNFNFTVDVNQTLIANAVWSAVNRTLTETQFTDTTNYTAIEDLISSYSNDLSEEDIWQYGARNLTYYPVQTDLTNYTLINEGVWAYNNRTLTYYEVANPNNLTAQEIWEYANRNLTYYPVQVDLTNYTLVGESVWTALNRTLTEFDFEVTINNTELVAEVWSYYNRTSTEIVDPFDYDYMQELVWNFTDRELTDIDWSSFDITVNTTINYSDIAQSVWDYLNRSLTDYNQTAPIDLTNYTLISEMVWDATERTLTDFNFTVEANINVSEVADAVWTSVNRSLTDYNQTTQIDLTDYDMIQDMVWNATVRTLTDYDHQTQLDLTDYDLIQEVVWNNTVRELTYYPTANLTLSEESVQALGDAVWNYDGNITTNILDQVAGKVQCYLNQLLEVNNGEWGIDIASC